MVGVFLEIISNGEFVGCISLFFRDIEEGYWVIYVINGVV